MARISFQNPNSVHTLKNAQENDGASKGCNELKSGQLQNWEEEIMRKGSGGEYSVCSTILQDCSLVCVHPPSPGREPPLILSSLPGPPSSLSLLTEEGGLGPDWMPRCPGAVVAGAPGAPVSTPHLLLDEAPPGAAASSLVTSKHSRTECIIHNPFCMHCVSFQVGQIKIFFGVVFIDF